MILKFLHKNSAVPFTSDYVRVRLLERKYDLEKCVLCLTQDLVSKNERFKCKKGTCLSVRKVVQRAFYGSRYSRYFILSIDLQQSTYTTSYFVISDRDLRPKQSFRTRSCTLYHSSLYRRIFPFVVYINCAF